MSTRGSTGVQVIRCTITAVHHESYHDQWVAVIEYFSQVDHVSRPRTVLPMMHADVYMYTSLQRRHGYVIPCRPSTSLLTYRPAIVVVTY